MLEDEDTLMGQLVVKATVYQKSMFQGGRGSDPRIFTMMDELRKQLADADAAAAKLNDNAPKGISKLAVKIDSELSPAMKQLKSIQEGVSTSFENGFMSMVDGTTKVKDAFRMMAADIIKELYRILVVKQITGFISDSIGGMFGGGVTSSPRPQARPASFAGGGYTGSGARAGGLDGKGGFMAMMHPRESVIDHTKGQNGGTTVVQNFHFAANGDDSVKKLIAQAAPQIAKMTEKGIIDSRRRGGQFRQVFG
jgi:phage-related minor tail protein